MGYLILQPLGEELKIYGKETLPGVFQKTGQGPSLNHYRWSELGGGYEQNLNTLSSKGNT